MLAGSTALSSMRLLAVFVVWGYIDLGAVLAAGELLMRRCALFCTLIFLGPSVVHAQAPDPLLPLLGSKAIQKELKLESEQIAELGKAPPKIVAQFKAERETLDRELAKLNQESAELVDRVDNELVEGVVKFLAPQQAGRFRQVRLHQLGVWAFHDSLVRKELGLTEKQLSEIQRLQDQFQDDLAALPEKVEKQAKGDAKEYTRLLEKEQATLILRAVEKIVASIDPDQQKGWDRLVGPPLTQRVATPTTGTALLAVTTTGQLITELATMTGAEIKMGPEALSKIALAASVMIRKHMEAWDKLQAQLYALGQRDVDVQLKMFQKYRELVQKDILKPAQWHRFEQLERQLQGLDVLLGPISKELGLTRQQKRKILELRQEFGRVGRNYLREPEALDAKLLVRKVQDENRRGVTELQKILDSNQRIVWSIQIGEPFDFTTITEFVALSPPALWVMPADQEALHRANQLAQQREYRLAVEALEEAIELNNKSPWGYNTLAFLLATCKDEKVRDGKRALELATKAMLLQPDEGEFMDTLAAASAEVGKFDQAVIWEQKALQKARPIRRSVYEARLKLYQEKKPYRE